MVSKTEFEDLLEEFQDLSDKYDLLLSESRTLVNYLLRIRRKCENESLWLMASCDPYKPLETEHQQGAMITRLFVLAQELKRKIK
jgi:hypothetical protein